MSFNLNKTDKPLSKFNLSKDAEPPVGKKDEKRSGKGMWVILTLLVAGGLAWYLFRGKPGDTVTATMSTMPQEPAKDSPAQATHVTGHSAALTGKAERPEPVNNNAAAGASANVLENSIPGSFAPGSSSLQPEATAVNDLISMLSKNPRKKILIKGYASSEGDLAFNRQLSGHRAVSFKEYLIGKGVAADRITTEARGIEDPIASNDTEAGRSKNRRVQVVITN